VEAERVGVAYMPNAPSVEVDGVWKIYQSTNRREPLVALQEINVKIHGGRFVSIIGPSGCGKSTLLHLIHGLVPPTRGSVRVGAKAVQHPRDTADLTRAMVFQDAMLLPWKTVSGNIAYGMEVGPRARKAVPQAAIEQRVEDCLQLTGLGGFERYYPHELSGGMRQRVNLARALATHPDVLLMDEPFSALDAQTRELMQEELLRICAAESRTVIFITHDLEEALFLSEAILVMSSRPGQVLEKFENPLPRSRDLSIKASDDFIKLKRHLWSLLEAEVRKTVAETEGDCYEKS
jgi:ABC-type nitrate/sulfonate/bicarbonate transport system ATPase subunit